MERINGPVTRIRNAEILACLPEGFIDVTGKFSRNIKFEAQFAHISYSKCRRRCVSYSKCFALSEPEVLIADVILGDFFQQFPGIGAYVCAPRSNLVVNVSLAGFSNDVNRQGVTPSSRILDTHVVSEPEQMLVDRMHLQPGDGVIIVERLRYVNNVPLAVHRVHINRRLCPRVLQADLAHVSLFSIFRDECGLELAHAEEQVYAALADERELELLHLTSPASVLRTERLTFLSSGAVVEFASATYCGECYRLSMTVEATG